MGRQTELVDALNSYAMPISEFNYAFLEKAHANIDRIEDEIHAGKRVGGMDEIHVGKG